VDEVSSSHAFCHRIASLSIPDHRFSTTIMAPMKNTTAAFDKNANFQPQSTTIIAISPE
jgi:hypothetical protein